MKRWTTVIGRVGTTLIAVSLALLLVSFVPSISTHKTEGSGPLGSGRMNILLYTRNFNPQQQIVGDVTVEGTVTLYILEVNLAFNFNLSSISAFGYNFTSADLQELLVEQPEKIMWEHTVENEDYKWSYSPTGVMNASLVAYTEPDSENNLFEYKVSLQHGLAPKDKVQTIAYWVAPIGIILAVPWLVSLWKQRKQKTE